MKCAWHLCNHELSGRQSKFCSVHCKDKYFVDKKRKSLKKKAVAYKGGKCSICGYDRCLEALIFHHLGNKTFGVGLKGYTRGWNRVQKELDSCVLLCSNCHAEMHAGHTTMQLPREIVVEKSGEFREIRQK